MLLNRYIRKNNLLANKGSYRQKHAEKSGDDTFARQERQALPAINDSLKEQYEAGKLLLIDKPLHWTSFDVVRKIRGRLRIKKVGHAGTLDPLATGLLILCTGKFTKKINEYMAQEKEYTGSFTLGAITPTYDLESLPEQHRDFAGITESIIQQAIISFTGEIRQMPPIYSAIKKQGTPLYELARRGETVELQSRTVFIHAFEIVSVSLPLVRFRIICSTGTYIRSIAHDLGIALGCGAYLSELRRNRIGEFEVTDAKTMEQFMEELIADS